MEKATPMGLGVQNFCGRAFNVDNTATTSITVCCKFKSHLLMRPGSFLIDPLKRSQSDFASFFLSILASHLPFQINYAANQNEVDKGKNNEQVAFPGGIVGFSLDYQQIPC